MILDLLRQISEKVMGLIVIGAGLPTFLDNPIFEKFCRGAESIILRGMSRDEIIDLILKPFKKIGLFSKHEIGNWFDGKSIMEIVQRGGGNPLHVKILCSKMFDHFQNDLSLKKIELNRSVMQKVNEFYSNISEKSRKIRRALQICNKSQLDSFSLLYQYEGSSIGAAILLEMAFNPLNTEEENLAKNRIVGALEDIWGLELFDIADKMKGQIK